MPYKKNQPKCTCGHSVTKHKKWLDGAHRAYTYCRCKNCECKKFKDKDDLTWSEKACEGCKHNAQLGEIDADPNITWSERCTCDEEKGVWE